MRGAFRLVWPEACIGVWLENFHMANERSFEKIALTLAALGVASASAAAVSAAPNPVAVDEITASTTDDTKEMGNDDDKKKEKDGGCGVGSCG